MNPADRFEQSQIGAAETLLVRKVDQDRGSRIADLVHGVAKARHEPTRCLGVLDRLQGNRVPPGVIRREFAVQVRQHRP